MNEGMRKNILILQLFLFVFAQIKGQTPVEGLYIKESTGEFICLNKDTISLKFYNYDAFSTYTLFFGTYELKNQTIKLGENLIENFTSSIEETNGIDSLVQFILLYPDSSPMKFAEIRILKKEKKNNIILGQTDDKGQLSIQKGNIANLLGSSVTIRVQTVGFTTEQLTSLEAGKKYTIKSKIALSYAFANPQKK